MSAMLHQVWVGGDPPAWVNRCWATWDEFMAEHHPDVQVRRWTDIDQFAPKSPIAESVRLASCYQLSSRALADLIRVQVVNRFGGLYFDSDTVPLRPLDAYLPRPAAHSGVPALSQPAEQPAWIGSAPATRDTTRIANASFGFPARHPFLLDVWKTALDALARGVRSDFAVAGPMAWGRVLRDYLRKHGPVIDVDYRFENETRDASIQRRMGKAEPFDSRERAQLSERYPGCPVLHVTFYSRLYR